VASRRIRKNGIADVLSVPAASLRCLLRPQSVDQLCQPPDRPVDGAGRHTGVAEHEAGVLRQRAPDLPCCSN
jgi:hypothetical protein